MKNRTVQLAATVAVIGLAGCANTKLATAREVGLAGVRMSEQLHAASSHVELGFSEALRQDRFLRALQTTGDASGGACYIGPAQSGTGLPPAARSDVPAAVVDKIATSLRARRELASALGQTYAAWTRLAEYDASGQVEAGVGEVFGAVNLLRQTWSLPAISGGVGSVVGAGAGAFAGQAQVRRLQHASRLLRRALVGYREGLIEGRPVTTSLVADQVGQRYALSIALWRRGYLDANSLLTRLGQTADLVVIDRSAARYTAKDERICQSVRVYLEGERDERRRAVPAEYDAQLAVIDEMIALQQTFEQDAPIDTAQLAIVLNRLTELARKLAPEATNG